MALLGAIYQDQWCQMVMVNCKINNISVDHSNGQVVSVYKDPDLDYSYGRHISNV